MAGKLKITEALAISIFLTVAGIWIPFLHLYWLNKINFSVPLALHVPLLVLVSGVVFVAALGMQLLVPRKFRLFLAGGLLFLAIFLWAESTLFLGKFGFFMGAAPDWAANHHLLYLELGLLVGLLGLVIFLKDRFVGNALWIASLLSVAALAILFPAYRTSHSQTPTRTKLVFTDDKIFDLSAQRNVLLFIVDTYQSDVFAQILTEHPAWREKFEGFTYFPDATSGFPKTYLSVPNILTGQAFDNSRPYSQYMKDAYLGDSAPHVLKKHGYDVRFKAFSWQPYFANPKVVDNLKGLGGSGSYVERQEFLRLCNLTLFRIAPFSLKPWVYNDDKFRLPATILGKKPADTPYVLQDKDREFSAGNDNFDLEFLDKFRAFLAVDSAKPTFRVFHLEGAHVPLVLDKDLNCGSARPVSRRAFKDQAEGVLKLLDLVFTSMKTAGIYDNSMIIVVGDHGAGEYPQVGERYDFLNNFGIEENFPQDVDLFKSEVVRGGMPLMLVKRVDHHGPLEVSRHQVQLGDIPEAIFSQLEFEEARSPSPLFAPQPPGPRTRIHRHYRFSGWGQDYIVPLREFAINGFSWNPDSWTPTGRDLNGMAIKSLGGRLVVMGQGGNLDQFEHSGWGKAQIQGRFMGEAMATVGMPVTGYVEPVFLKIRLKEQYSPLKPVTMKISADGHWLANWTVGRKIPNTFQTLLPAQLFKGRKTITLGFDLGNRWQDSPQFVEIRLANSEAYQWRYKLGRLISFKTNGGGQPFLTRGWGDPEDWGTWTAGYQSDVLLNLESGAKGDLELRMDILPALYPGSPPVDFSIAANGVPLKSFAMSTPGRQTIRLVIPAVALGRGKFLQLSFNIKNPRAPRDFTDSLDPRELGINLGSMVVRNVPDQSDLASADLFKNVVDENGAAQTTGFWPRENWEGVPVVWSRGIARVCWPLHDAEVPAWLNLTIAKGSPAGNRLVVFANGTLVGAGRLEKIPGQMRVSLAEVSAQDSLAVTLYCDTLVPGDPDPGNGDTRELGLAYTSIKLAFSEGSKQESNSEAVVLPRPYGLDLSPHSSAMQPWSGLHHAEKWGSDVIAWTDGAAHCTVAWSGQQAPRWLLVDVAAADARGTTMSLDINGVKVIPAEKITGKWSALVDLKEVPKADVLDITLASGSFVPAEVNKGSQDTRKLGVALKKLVILE